MEQLFRVGAAAMKTAVVTDGVEDTRRRVHATVLQHHPDVLAEAALIARRVETEHPHAAACSTPIALAHFDGAGLAGAVRPEHRSDLTSLRRETHVLNSDEVAVTHGEVANIDSSHGREGTAKGLQMGRCPPLAFHP